MRPYRKCNSNNNELGEIHRSELRERRKAEDTHKQHTVANNLWTFVIIEHPLFHSIRSYFCTLFPYDNSVKIVIVFVFVGFLLWNFFFDLIVIYLCPCVGVSSKRNTRLMWTWIGVICYMDDRHHICPI